MGDEDDLQKTTDGVGSSAHVSPPVFDDDVVTMLTDQRYPMLYARGRDVDDAILQEVFVNLRTGGADLHTVDIPDGWLGLLQVPWIFTITQRPLQILGGMLYADGLFLFDSLPFVCARSKEVKCRMENPEAIATPGDMSQSMMQAVSESLQMSAATRYLASMAAVPGGKVVFKLTEYECCCMYFVVQVFQLVTDGVPMGKIFLRAFYPFKPLRRTSRAHSQNLFKGTSDTSPASQKVGGDEDNATAQPNLSPSNEDLDPSTWGGRRKDFGTWKARRRAVPGEERLRLLKPWFYVWCLDRDPSDLGTATTTIKLSLLYYKHNFTMIRLVRHLMACVRRIQRFIRRRLATKARTQFIMIAMWEKMEAEVQEKLTQYQPARGDPVDAAVNRALRGSVSTTREHKIHVIGNLLRQRKAAYLAATPEQRAKDHHLFTWMINPNVLFLDSQKRVIDKLTSGPESVFNDKMVQQELLRLQAESGAGDKDNTARMKRTGYRNSPTRRGLHSTGGPNATRSSSKKR